MVRVDPATLQKLAALLREVAERREGARLTKAARVLSAAKGLLILREKARNGR